MSWYLEMYLHVCPSASDVYAAISTMFMPICARCRPRCMRLLTFVRVCACMYVCMYLCVCVYVCMHLNMRAWVESDRSRCFGFVEFEDPDDAAHAMENKVLKINIAKPNAIRNRAG
jgi:RNA recognition motif-containing protein